MAAHKAPQRWGKPQPDGTIVHTWNSVHYTLNQNIKGVDRTVNVRSIAVNSWRLRKDGVDIGHVEARLTDRNQIVLEYCRYAIGGVDHLNNRIAELCHKVTDWFLDDKEVETSPLQSLDLGMGFDFYLRECDGPDDPKAAYFYKVLKGPFWSFDPVSSRAKLFCERELKRKDNPCRIHPHFPVILSHVPTGLRKLRANNFTYDSRELDAKPDFPRLVQEEDAMWLKVIEMTGKELPL